MRKNYFELSKVSKLMRKISPIFLLCTCLTLGLTSCDSSDDPKETLVVPNEFVQVISGDTFEIGGQQVDINQVIADANADAKAHIPANYALVNDNNQVVTNYVLDHNPCTTVYTLDEMNGSYTAYKEDNDEIFVLYIYEGHMYVYAYEKAYDTWIKKGFNNRIAAYPEGTESYILDIKLEQLEDHSFDMTTGLTPSAKATYLQQLMTSRSITYEEALKLYESTVEQHQNIHVYYTNKKTHSFVVCRHYSNPDSEDRDDYHVNEDAAYANDFWVVQFTF